MYSKNQSVVTEFILLGLSEDPVMQVVLFPIFLIIYTTTLAGNLLLVVAVRTDKRLHNSMYLFLATFSILDILYTSVIVPKMLVNFLSLEKSISYNGCAIQVFFYLFWGETESILLAFMAYDRYVAICHPLRYNTIMSTTVCLWMISFSFLIGCIISSFDVYFIFSLTYCGPNTINHFFCESPLVTKLSCSDTSSGNILALVGSVIVLLIPLLLILISYVRIIVAIMRIDSGKYKAFSTCGSHFVVVAITYGTVLFMYMRPQHLDTGDTDKTIAVFYTAITPMLNPLIYSLRNKDVHRAMRRLDVMPLIIGTKQISTCPSRITHRKNVLQRAKC
ncbi:olfactory receptor 5AP2-like [Hyperolius riggenbachi]|uniref:olfactory receptor 5AP2-like n=1 Tax=Hyperolius riggenbachi TaxID=752182 RepID=UPI0035A3CA57